MLVLKTLEWCRICRIFSKLTIDTNEMNNGLIISNLIK
jgi:hypothetical protein